MFSHHAFSISMIKHKEKDLIGTIQNSVASSSVILNDRGSFCQYKSLGTGKSSIAASRHASRVNMNM